MADRDMQREGTENQIRGGAEELKGKVRGKFGDVTDDRSEQVGGRVDELKGKVRRKLGESQEKSGRKSGHESEDIDRSRM